MEVSIIIVGVADRWAFDYAKIINCLLAHKISTSIKGPLVILNHTQSNVNYDC